VGAVPFLFLPVRRRGDGRGLLSKLLDLHRPGRTGPSDRPGL